MYDQTFLDKLNRKYGRHSIRNLMAIIVAGMAAVFVVDLILTPSKGISLSSFLVFDRAAILQGQIWRVLSFIFIPGETNIIFVVFALYFYWLIGSALESYWGSFRFNVFYLIGVLATIVIGFISGYATNMYLNLSLFFAFALIYPDFEIRLFFFIPIKIKYLAFLDAALFLLSLIMVNWQTKLCILIALANVILFFGRDFITRIKNIRRRMKYRRDANNNWR